MVIKITLNEEVSGTNHDEVSRLQNPPPIPLAPSLKLLNGIVPKVVNSCTILSGGVKRIVIERKSHNIFPLYFSTTDRSITNLKSTKRNIQESELWELVKY